MNGVTKVTSANVFKIIDSVELVVRNTGGTFQQLKVYERSGQLYAKQGASFIAITKAGGTSKPTVEWKEFVCTTNEPFEYKIGAIGWLEAA